MIGPTSDVGRTTCSRNGSLGSCCGTVFRQKAVYVFVIIVPHRRWKYARHDRDSQECETYVCGCILRNRHHCLHDLRDRVLSTVIHFKYFPVRCTQVHYYSVILTFDSFSCFHSFITPLNTCLHSCCSFRCTLRFRVARSAVTSG